MPATIERKVTFSKIRPIRLVPSTGEEPAIILPDQNRSPLVIHPPQSRPFRLPVTSHSVVENRSMLTPTDVTAKSQFRKPLPFTADMVTQPVQIKETQEQDTTKSFLLALFADEDFIHDPNKFSIDNFPYPIINDPEVNKTALLNILNGKITEEHLNRVFQTNPPASYKNESLESLNQNINVASRLDSALYSYKDLIAFYYDTQTDQITTQQIQHFFANNSNPLIFFNCLPQVYLAAEDSIGYQKVKEILPSLVRDFAKSLYGNMQVTIADSLISIIKDARGHRSILEKEPEFLSTGKKLKKRNNFSILHLFRHKMKSIGLDNSNLSIVDMYADALESPLDNKIPRGDQPSPKLLKEILDKQENIREESLAA